MVFSSLYWFNRFNQSIGLLQTLLLLLLAVILYRNGRNINIHLWVRPTHVYTWNNLLGYFACWYSRLKLVPVELCKTKKERADICSVRSNIWQWTSIRFNVLFLLFFLHLFLLLRLGAMWVLKKILYVIRYFGEGGTKQKKKKKTALTICVYGTLLQSLTLCVAACEMAMYVDDKKGGIIGVTLTLTHTHRESILTVLICN